MRGPGVWRPSATAHRTGPVASYRINSLLLSRPRRRSQSAPAPCRGIASSVPGKTVFKYIPLEGVEKLERYRPGGFHPVAIGDILHSRYYIVHKLGFGAYSTTWLAQDQTAGRYVAVKIAVATDNFLESNVLRELRVRHLWNGDRPGKDIIPPVLHEFILNGPNGEHRCFVTAAARMSLSTAKDASSIRLFQLPVARAIAAQLVQAVAFLHSERIVHADLHLGNILLRLPKSLDDLSLDGFYQKYGRPLLEPVVRLDDDNEPLPSGVPSHGVMPVWLGKDSEFIPLSEDGILRTDFGEAFQPSTTRRYHSHTPDLLIPPEVFFLSQESLSFPADIWTLAGTIFAIIGQRPLFDGFSSSSDLVIEDHVDVLGKLPPEWWARWQARSKWFDDDGTMCRGLGRPWAKRFEYAVQEPRQEERGVEKIGEEETADLSSMLKAMMRFRPGERSTADEVLQCEWMRKWALPEIDEMRRWQ